MAATMMIDAINNIGGDFSMGFEGPTGMYVDLMVKYYGLCWVFHIISAVLSYFLFPAYLEKESKKSTGTDQKKLMVPTTFADKVNWDYTVASIAYCAMVFYFYLVAVAQGQEKGTIEARWTEQTPAAVHGITLHVASSLYETTCYVFANKGLVFYLHHVVTVGGCCSMLLFQRGSYWCCLLGLVEGTNIPLGFVLGGPFRTTEWIKNSIAYKINGVLLWVMYLVIRVPIPYAMYLLHKDLNGHPDVAYVFDDKAKHTAWVYYMDFVCLFLWGLSLLWFSQITSGMLKALGIGGKKKKTA